MRRETSMPTLQKIQTRNDTKAHKKKMYSLLVDICGHIHQKKFQDRWRYGWPVEFINSSSHAQTFYQPT